jgi:ankyrin repeat protein
MVKCMLLLAFALCMVDFSTAQTPVELTYQEMNIWEHVTGPRVTIRINPAELSPRDRGFPEVDLDVVVSPGGRVLQAHATGGPAQLYEEAESIERARVFLPFRRNGVPILAKIKDWVSIAPPEEWLTNKVAFPEKTDFGHLFISLRRTACMGTCPSYTVVMDGSGLIQFQGNAFVLVPGRHLAHVSQDTVRALVNDFRKADFLSAKDSYSAMVTDSPTQTITFRMGETSKTVTDYVGIEAGLPDVIRDLEDQIDAAAGTKRWIKGNGETGKALLDEHWDFGSGSADNMALYRSAIQNKNDDLVKMFLRAKAPVDIFDESRRVVAPICVASRAGDFNLVEQMAALQPKMKPGVVQPCLTAAALGGNVDLFDLWIDKGAKPETTNDLLRNGISSSNPAMVRRILEFPVDVHARFNEIPLLNYTVAQSRERSEDTEIVGLLLKAGASPNDKDSRGQTALFSVGLQRSQVRPLISILVASGADVNIRDNNGETALMCHAFILDVVDALLAAGADPTPTDRRGQTAAVMARQFSCPLCAEALEQAARKRSSGAAEANHP